MAIAPGTKLGAYEILAPIGAGGMGEVHRARDTRLNRIVAVKVLPAHVSENAESRQRFEREAQAIASLNHPHICTIHDVGRHDGIDYLVMEYLEGETLAERVGRRGTLPLADALRIAMEIADGLDSAHRHGITHRDLKPSNIMLTASGAKLLDFGLAKVAAQQVSAGQDAVTALPTNLTGQGMIVGTLQYMAPEQLEGAEADERTDIFAFGSLLYEMLTGRKAFEGRSQASLISAIMTLEPPAITASEKMTPPALDHLVKRCLAKNPNDRWQSIRDVYFELKWIAEADPRSMSATAEATPRKSDRMPWLVSIVLLLLLIVAWIPGFMYFRRSPEIMPTVRFDVQTPSVFTNTLYSYNLALSPDGRAIAYAEPTGDGRTLIHVHDLASLSSRQLSGTENGTAMFWSPDSRFIGFFTGRELKKISASGGTPQTLAAVAGAGTAGAWNKDNLILYSTVQTRGIWKVSGNGGEPSPVIDEANHLFRSFLPDGRRFMFGSPQGTFVGSLDSNERHQIFSSPAVVGYADGHLFYVREGALFAQAFDADALQLSGEPVSLADGIAFTPTRYAFSVSENGVIAYRRGTAISVLNRLRWFARDGKQLNEVGQAGLNLNPELSPDESRVAVQMQEPIPQRALTRGDIWLVDLLRGAPMRLTSDEGEERFPIWSPDGTQIVFGSNRGGQINKIYRRSSNGADAEAVFLDSEFTQPLDWSADGRFVIYRHDPPNKAREIWALPATAGGKPFPLEQSEFENVHASLSPDGKWLAFVTNQSGRFQVVLRTFPELKGKWPVSIDGGMEPRWRGDSKELFYIGADGNLMAVKIGLNNDSTPNIGLPEPLFQTPLSGTNYIPGYIHGYDVSRDGKRFLIRVPPADTASVPLTVLVNWRSIMQK